MKNKFKNKKLLIITNGYPSEDNKITDSIFVKNQVDELSKHFKKINVIVISPILPKILKSVFKQYKNRTNLKDYSYSNVNVYYSKYFKLPNNLSYKTFNLEKSVFNIINKKEIKFDLIHAHFLYPAGIVALKVKQKFNKKLIVTGHGFDVYDYPYRTKTNKKNYIDVLKNVDFFITVSKKNYLIANSFLDVSNKSKVINNGFVSTFENKDKSQSKKKLNLCNKKIILHVGTYKINIKNQINLLKAIKELTKTRSDFMLYLIGSGKDKKKILHKIKELKLDNFVIMLGSLSHEDVSLWMSASDLLVLPSYFESFGVVQIEAMASGLPVVATINGGSEDIIIHEKNGFLFKDPNDFLKLCNLINLALNKEWCLKFIIENNSKYFIQNICFEILEEYNKLIND